MIDDIISGNQTLTSDDNQDNKHRHLTNGDITREAEKDMGLRPNQDIESKTNLGLYIKQEKTFQKSTFQAHLASIRKMLFAIWNFKINENHVLLDTGAVQSAIPENCSRKIQTAHAAAILRELPFLESRAKLANGTSYW